MRLQLFIAFLIATSSLAAIAADYSDADDPTITGPTGNNSGVIGANDYPLWSQFFEQQGTVTLRILVLEDGRISEASVLKSSGSSALDRASLDIVKARFHYTPATHDGKPIAVWSKVIITWSLYDTGTEVDLFSGEYNAPVPDPLPPGSWRPDQENTITANYDPRAPSYGTTTVRLRVRVRSDETVERAQLTGSSGYQRADIAAMRMVTERWRFPVPNPPDAWISTSVSYRRHEGHYPLPLPRVCRDVQRIDAPPPGPTGQPRWPAQFLINEDGSAGTSIEWREDAWHPSTLANDINKEHRFLGPKHNGVPAKCWFDLNIPGVR